jgi:hypothetical protein
VRSGGRVSGGPHQCGIVAAQARCRTTATRLGRRFVLHAYCRGGMIPAACAPSRTMLMTGRCRGTGSAEMALVVMRRKEDMV